MFVQNSAVRMALVLDIQMWMHFFSSMPCGDSYYSHIPHLHLHSQNPSFNISFWTTLK